MEAWRRKILSESACRRISNKRILFWELELPLLIRFSGVFLLIHLESRFPCFFFAAFFRLFFMGGNFRLQYLADVHFIRALIVGDGIAYYREILPLINSPRFRCLRLFFQEYSVVL